MITSEEFPILCLCYFCMGVVVIEGNTHRQKHQNPPFFSIRRCINYRVFCTSFHSVTTPVVAKIVVRMKSASANTRKMWVVVQASNFFVYVYALEGVHHREQDSFPIEL